MSIKTGLRSCMTTMPGHGVRPSVMDVLGLAGGSIRNEHALLLGISKKFHHLERVP